MNLSRDQSLDNKSIILKKNNKNNVSLPDIKKDSIQIQNEKALILPQIIIKQDKWLPYNSSSSDDDDKNSEKNND